MKDRERELRSVYRYSLSNKRILKKNEVCGCFFCKQIFNPSEIKEWVPDRNGPTAICPYCGIDSVIPESVCSPMTVELLEEMCECWFGKK